MDILVKRLIPAAVKLHTDRLLVKPVVGGLAIMQFISEVCYTHVELPAGHESVGVLGADFVLYVTGEPLSSFVVVCSEADDNGRPTSAVMNLHPEDIVATRQYVRMIAHGIAHALGFDVKRMAARGMMTTGKTATRRWVNMVTARRTMWAARWYYNCSTAQGMELEDEVENWSSSHWKRCNAKDELMSAYLDETGGAYYTALTLAAFEDTGYFRANFGMAEWMGWGRNAGCGFLDKKCIENNVTKFPHTGSTKISTTTVLQSAHAAGRAV